MDEATRYHVTLADGSEFDAVDDRAGNMLVLKTDISEDALSEDNLTAVEISMNDGEPVSFENQVLRTFYEFDNTRYLIRFTDMNDLEKIVADYSAKLDYIACMAGVDLDE